VRSGVSYYTELVSQTIGMGGVTIRCIAVLEDDADIRELIGLYLQRESMEPVPFESPVKFLAWLDVQKAPPDLLILDLMMPELSGTDVIKSVRKRPACDTMPIVVCSAKSTESDVILTLGLGADTYVRKPFSPRELVAQVGAMLRRSQTVPTAVPHTLRVGSLSVDSARKSASVGGKLVDLTPAEFCILLMLVQHKGSVVSREDLLRATGDTDAVERVADVHITSIRRKLGEASHVVRTSRGFGYYVDEEVS
jgi:DNA-binding response OmpR family regulator